MSGQMPKNMVYRATNNDNGTRGIYDSDNFDQKIHQYIKDSQITTCEKKVIEINGRIYFLTVEYKKNQTHISLKK